MINLCLPSGSETFHFFFFTCPGGWNLQHNISYWRLGQAFRPQVSHFDRKASTASFYYLLQVLVCCLWWDLVQVLFTRTRKSPCIPSWLTIFVIMSSDGFYWKTFCIHWDKFSFDFLTWGIPQTGFADIKAILYFWNSACSSVFLILIFYLGILYLCS